MLAVTVISRYFSHAYKRNIAICETYVCSCSLRAGVSKRFCPRAT